MQVDKLILYPLAWGQLITSVLIAVFDFARGYSLESSKVQQIPSLSELFQDTPLDGQERESGDAGPHTAPRVVRPLSPRVVAYSSTQPG